MWDTHWRPTLHCLGILVHGVCEMYMISNADCPKDSNMQMSALTWALDLSQEILAKRGLALPLHLVVQCDNTCREGRNQWLFLWCSEMVASGRFNSISPIFFRTGHTHFIVDRRFSIVAHTLSKANVLETPEAGPGCKSLYLYVLLPLPCCVAFAVLCLILACVLLPLVGCC